ncbi:MAG: metal ABC transporter ATP-binding protein [Spirochaetaceae bacterium]|nr:metal ABC transporter ATP-binding protein [Spirochaetaceae bacterium]
MFDKDLNCTHEHCTRCSQKSNSLHGNKNGHICCTKIENLSVKSADHYILENINLHIHCGELTAIIGRNGAGKTTFLRTLLEEVPHTGGIHFMKDGKGCTSKPKFGYVPQKLEVSSDSPVSVGDLVLSCLSKRPVWLPRRKKDKILISDVLSATGVQHLESRRVSDLSGGELQRIMLALAIRPLPDILLLDEPVSGVDRSGLSIFYEIVSQLRHTHDITILLISHDLDLVAKYADKVVLIDRRIVVQGKPEEVYKSDEFIQAFGSRGGIL